MKELIILYQIWVLDLEKFIDATIIYYDIDYPAQRRGNVEKILENTWYWEYIENQLANTRHEYKFKA